MVTLSAGAARADGPDLPQLPMSHSADSYDLYGELRMYSWGCPKVDEAKKKAMVAHVLAVVGKITDDFDHRQFDTYARGLKTWFDAYDAGVPGVGTWPALEKSFATAKAALDGMPGQTPTDPASIKAAIAVYQTIRAQAPQIAKLDNAVYNTPCGAYPGAWIDLDHGLADAVTRADQQIAEGTGPTLEAYRAWKGAAPAADPIPSTYWEHVAATAALVDYVGSAVAVQGKFTNLSAWLPALSGDAAATATEAPGALTAAINTVGAQAAALLPEIAMPPLKKDAGRTRLVDKALAGADGKRVGIVTTPGGTSKQTWTEDVVVREDSERQWVRTYTSVREYYTTYYAWKPTAPPALAGLAGIDPADVCELWSQNFARYLKGPPSVADKKSWFAWENHKEGYILCKNAGAVSKKKIK
jgi:hypothetical protein